MFAAGDLCAHGGGRNGDESGEGDGLHGEGRIIEGQGAGFIAVLAELEGAFGERPEGEVAGGGHGLAVFGDDGGLSGDGFEADCTAGGGEKQDGEEE